jgi:hypothetical protein
MPQVQHRTDRPQSDSLLTSTKGSHDESQIQGRPDGATDEGCYAPLERRQFPHSRATPLRGRRAALPGQERQRTQSAHHRTKRHEGARLERHRKPEKIRVVVEKKKNAKQRERHCSQRIKSGSKKAVVPLLFGCHDFISGARAGCNDLHTRTALEATLRGRELDRYACIEIKAALRSSLVRICAGRRLRCSWGAASALLAAIQSTQHS